MMLRRLICAHGRRSIWGNHSISTQHGLGRVTELCRPPASVRTQVRAYRGDKDDDPDSYEAKEDDDEAAEEALKKREEMMKKDEEEVSHNFLPREIVDQLDKYIIGQANAKRAVAVALRNRWRRHRVSKDMKDDIIPKNILMIGPTGVGKTEIARRLAKLVHAPFIKVEATKFTEVGFYGRDVDQIIRDLVDIAIKDTKARLAKRHKVQVDENVEKAILEALLGPGPREETYVKSLRDGMLDHVTVEVEVPDNQNQSTLSRRVGGRGTTYESSESTSSILMKLLDRGSGSLRKRKMSVRDARKALERKERDSLADQDTIVKLAIHSAEQDGIVFIDEIDKICESQDVKRGGADASSEGVQRDLLPIIEGSIVNTKHGNVDTTKMLFICSGAFHGCKPSDLISELQGRLPIRVELKGLTQNDLFRILTEPTNNQIQQHIQLMKTENVDIEFTERAIRAVARIASEVNSQVEDIGARRLHTIMEKITEEVSYNCDKFKDTKIVIDEEDVKKNLGDMLLKTDLSRFIL